MVVAHSSKYSSLIYEANRRGISFSLPYSEFLKLMNQPCIYCGAYHVGIDRFDNNLGYSVHNSVPCCKRCNSMKSNLPVHVFLTHVNNIALFTLSDDEIKKRLSDFQSD